MNIRPIFLIGRAVFCWERQERPFLALEESPVQNMQTLSKGMNICFMSLLLSITCTTGSVILSPKGNYTVFQSNARAVLTCSGDGTIALWTLNGNISSGYEVTITPYDPRLGTVVPSNLSIIPNANYNNTQVVCTVVTIPTFNTFQSLPTRIIIQGPLDAPSNFSVNISNNSNTTFLLSWGAPFSLDVTDSPDIFYYTLCTNITIYGCKNISSDPDCTFPRTCTSSVDFTDPSLNGTNGGQNKTIMDYGDPIHFTFIAVNGAGKGNVSEHVLSKKESAPSQKESRSTNTLPTTTPPPLSIGKSEKQTLVAAVSVAVVVMCTLIAVVLGIVVFAFKRKRKPSEPAVDVELYSYATHQKKSTIAAANNKMISETHYMDVACHPIISIPAPHQKVLYSEVKPQNEKPKPDPNGYIDVECHPVISIPAPHHEVQYTKTINTMLIDHRVGCDSEENGNEGDSRWCQHSDPAQKATTAHMAPGVDLVAKHADVSKSSQRILSEHTVHHQALSSDLFGIKPFKTEYHPYEGTACTDDTSPFFAFASTITPQCTKLSPTVLVHESIEAECNSDNSHILKDDQSYTDSSNDKQDDCVSNKSAGPIIIEATAAFVENGLPLMPHIVNISLYELLSWDILSLYAIGKGDQSYTDTTNVLQDAVKKEEIIYIKAIMKNNMHTSPQWMTPVIKKITKGSTLNIAQLSNMSPFVITCKGFLCTSVLMLIYAASSHWSTPEQKQSTEVSVTGRYDYWLWFYNNIRTILSCASCCGFVQ